MNIWKRGLPHIFNALNYANLSHDIFTMGGGTALMHFLNHRISNDLDIFLANSQYLNYFLPSLNSYLESVASDYNNQANFIKIQIDSYEIDFIIAQNITGIRTRWEVIDGFNMPMDHPFEIIAKKIFYRHDSFTIRDIFDLAMVYNSDSIGLVTSLSVISSDIFKSLSVRIRDMAQNDMATTQMESIARLPNSEVIAGKEFSLCIEFIDAIRNRQTS